MLLPLTNSKSLRFGYTTVDWSSTKLLGELFTKFLDWFYYYLVYIWSSQNFLVLSLSTKKKKEGLWLHANSDLFANICIDNWDTWVIEIDSASNSKSNYFFTIHAFIFIQADDSMDMIKHIIDINNVFVYIYMMIHTSYIYLYIQNNLG